MADIVRYVDTDVVGGLGDGTSWANAYSSLNAFEAAEQVDLVSAGDTMTVNCRGVAADTNTVYFTGWTTGASNFITVIGDWSALYQYDSNKYVINTSSPSNPTVSVRQNYTVVKNVQIQQDNTTANGYAYECLNSNCTLEKSFLQKYSSGGFGGGVSLSGFNVTGNTVQNCIIQDMPGYGIRINTGGTNTHNIYNNTIYNCDEGIFTEWQTNAVSKNNVIFSCNDDFNDTATGTLTIDYCASDDGDGTNSISPASSDWSNEFTDYASGDFSILNSGNLYNGGTTVVSVTDDIKDTSRPQSTAYDVGAYELVVAGGVNIPVIVNQLKQQGIL